MSKIKSKFDLTGKVAIITGSSKGIGKSIARGLAEFGAKVVVSSRKQEAVDTVAEEFRNESHAVYAKACHVGDQTQLENLVLETVNRYGRIDILVNNAGTNPYFGPLEEMGHEVYQKTLDINLNAALKLSNLIHPYFKKQGGGSIIHISSIEGFHPSAMMSAYNISKAGLIMLCKNQAVEWASDNIRVNCICPGLVRTKLSAALFADEKHTRQMLDRIPMKRAADPDEIAGMACFLASDAASYCTGTSILNDGGLMMAPLF